ncbi:beta strand repeat-containing protein, partial [Sphingorhabdus wooponensis]
MVGVAVRVVATTTDALGGSSVFISPAQSAIANVEDEATGSLGVTGVAEEGSSLIAALASVVDADGVTTTAYQWQELAGLNWVDIVGATAAQLSIPSDQSYVDKVVRVVATTTDPFGGTSVFVGGQQTIDNVEDEATASLTITGEAQPGGTLSVTVINLADSDGAPVASYQWQQLVGPNWVNIATQTAATLNVTNALVNSDVRAVVTSTDARGGTTEFVSETQRIVDEVLTIAEALALTTYVNILSIGITGTVTVAEVTDLAARVVAERGGTVSDLIQSGFLNYDLLDNYTAAFDASNAAIVQQADEVTVFGNNVSDNIDLQAITRSMTIEGRGDDDFINGGQADDFIDAGSGNDTLAGNFGDDTLVGGTGNDTFIIDEGNDLIRDLGEGNDDIEIRNGASLDAHLVNNWAPINSTNNGDLTISLQGWNADLSLLGGTGDLVVYTESDPEHAADFTSDTVAGQTIVLPATASSIVIHTSAATGLITVDASLVTDEDFEIVIDGDGTVQVFGLVADLDATDLTGTLGVLTGDAAGDAISIATGSADTTVVTGDLSDTVTVDALELLDDNLLAVSGPAAVVINNVIADIDAIGLTGTLDVTTVDAPTITIDTGTGDTTVDNSAMSDGNVLTLTGAADTTVGDTVADIDATGLAGTLGVTTGDAPTITIDTGTGDTTVENSAMSDGNVLTLTGAADTTVSTTVANIVATGLTGTLDVTTGNAPTITIDTGTGVTTVENSAMSDGTELTLTGAADTTVTTTVADIDATGLAGTLDVTTGNAPTITIDTGTGVTTVENSAMSDGTELTLTGAADTTVTTTVADIDATGLTGTLGVTTGNAPTITIETGAGDTTVDNDAMLDNAVLTLTGAANTTVGDTVADIDATALTGTLGVTTGDAADGAISIETGSADTTVVTGHASDTVTVDALALLDDNVLTVSGPAAVVVNNDVADINAEDLLGTLNVTTADAATITINTSILVGAGATTINNSAMSDDASLTLTGDSNTIVGDLLTGGTSANIIADGHTGILEIIAADVATLSVQTNAVTTSIEASSMTDTAILTVSLGSDVTINNNIADVDASNLTGTLTVNVLDAGDDAVFITTGSNDTTINSTAGDDQITVNAAAQADDTLLTVSGPAAVVVSTVIANIDATALAGTLDVTTADAVGITIDTGTGLTTITNDAMSDNAVLTLTGAANTTVSDTVADIDATGLTGTLGVTTADAPAITIDTGTGDTTVDNDAMSDNTVLTLTGAADTTVSDTVADIDATGLTGTLGVTTADAPAITIDTGTGVTNVENSAMSDNAVLTLTGAADTAVSTTVADIDATGLTGTLGVTTGDADITIDTGAGLTAITNNAMSDGNVLTLTGLANTTVSTTVADIDATGLTITIDTGAGATTVENSAMSDDTVLTLTGAANTTVSDTVADIDATGLTGTLGVTTGDAPTITINTGAGATTVENSAMSDDTVLTLTGLANTTVSDTVADIDATG